MVGLLLASIFTCIDDAVITLCYKLAKQPLPVQLQAHSIRAVSASLAFLGGMSLEDIYNVATRSLLSIFMTQYALSAKAWQDASFGQLGLRFIFH